MFTFRQFTIDDTHCAQKVGSDSVLLGARAFTSAVQEGFYRGLDLGCGSGLLSLMLAQRFHGLKITGVEIDAEACADARHNFSASPWEDRLNVVCADVFDFALESGNAHAYDLIISNPPYFKNSLLPPDAARSMARHGFAPEALPGMAARMLKPGGRLAMVTPADCEKSIRFQAALARMSLRRLDGVETKPGKPVKRLLWEFVYEPAGMQGNASEEVEGGRESLGVLTPEQCRELTVDFYL